VASKFVTIHINCDSDKEAWSFWTKQYKPPGNGIPMIWVVNPAGELTHSQMGAPQGPKLVEFLSKYAKELSKAVLSSKQLGLLKAAAKEADALLESGNFVSAYYKLSEFSEELKSDNKALTKVKATLKKIEQAAFDKIASAKESVETGLSESKRLDGAFQLTVVAGKMSEAEAVSEKAEAAIKALKDDAKNAELFKQAKLLYEAREAVADEETDKAKKIYEKVIADFKGTEAARRAKTKLDGLQGGS